jgi:hypothetical protein
VPSQQRPENRSRVGARRNQQGRGSGGACSALRRGGRPPGAQLPAWGAWFLRAPIAGAREAAAEVEASASASVESVLARTSAAEQRALAAALLANMSEEDMRALLQGMRPFAWEVNGSAQTDGTGQEATADESAAAPATPGGGATPKVKRLDARAKRGLSAIQKNLTNAKSRMVPLSKVKRQIANMYEQKITHDEASDLEGNRRDEMPNFVLEFMLNNYGVKSLASQHLGSLSQTVSWTVQTQATFCVWAAWSLLLYFSFWLSPRGLLLLVPRLQVREYGTPGATKFDARVYVFGEISGILDPYKYYSMNVSFVMDFLRDLFQGQISVVDESLNRDRPCVRVDDPSVAGPIHS